VDFPERTCQPAAARLWGSRNIEHKKNDISFILNPMVMEFLRDVCKDMKHIVVEGHVTGAMEQREYACQPAGTLLRGSRDIMYKNIYNSFVLGSMAMKFC
jgi:hypothetical protein